MTREEAFDIGYRRGDGSRIPPSLWADYWKGMHEADVYHNYRVILAQRGILPFHSGRHSVDGSTLPRQEAGERWG